MTQLHDAINRFVPLRELKEIIDVNPSPIKLFERDEGGFTPFEICIRNNDYGDEILIYLLKESPKVSTKIYVEYLSWSIEENRSSKLMKAIIQCDPSCVYLKDVTYGLNSICHVMFRFYHVMHNLTKNQIGGKDVLKREIFDFASYDGSILTIQYIVDVIEVILRASTRSVSLEEEKEKREWNILLAAIENEYCPWSWCEILLSLFPEKSSLFILFEVRIDPHSKIFYHENFVCSSCIEWFERGWINCDGRVSRYCDFCFDKVSKDVKRTYICFEVEKKIYCETEFISFLFSWINKNPSICCT